MKKRKKIKTLILAAVLGFAVSMAVMAISIYFGYMNAYHSSVDSGTVSLFGLKIYSLVKAGERYVGVSIGPNMGIICSVFIAAAIIIERILALGKRKK
ncbi:MAG: LlsX family protein [Oscillospiraceae bacterium]|nr:LlsX family protein [Oscillospiraceae bacterium]